MEIVENQPEYLSEFISLNEQWVTEHFQLEDTDRLLAANPRSVIDNGGYIFSLISNGVVLGVCALFNDGDNVFELARMAVSPEHHNKGCGQLLMLACLSKISVIGTKKVYLVSNTTLSATISLNKKNSFKTVSQGQHPVYSRANIIMERYVYK